MITIQSLIVPLGIVLAILVFIYLIAKIVNFLYEKFSMLGYYNAKASEHVFRDIDLMKREEAFKKKEEALRKPEGSIQQ